MAAQAWISLGAMFVSLAALVANLLTATTQRRLNVLAYLRQYHADVRKWADEVLDVMSEAQWAFGLDSEGPDTHGLDQLRRRLAWRLSSLADRGRFFFPNEQTGYGEQKLAAFQGFRHEALDCIIHSFRDLAKLDPNEPSKFALLATAIEQNKKAFVNHIAEALGPRAYRRQVDQLAPIAGLKSRV